MKAIVMFILMCFILPSVTYANVSCDILSKGNKLYQSKKYKEALNALKAIEDFDKIGKESCTDSVYATIGTIYKILGNKQLKSNSYKAALYYKSASKYNRAFAYASLCSNANECKGSKDFWRIK